MRRTPRDRDALDPEPVGRPSTVPPAPPIAQALAISSSAGNQALGRWLDSRRLSREPEETPPESAEAQAQSAEGAEEEDADAVTTPEPTAEVDVLDESELPQLQAAAMEQDQAAAEPEEAEQPTAGPILARSPILARGVTKVVSGKKKHKAVKKGIGNFWSVPTGAPRVTWATYNSRVKNGEEIGGLVFPDEQPGATAPFVIPVPLPPLALRKDAAVIRESISAISKHMHTYSKRVMKIALPKKYVVVTAKQIGSWRAKVTEGMGELAASTYIQDHFPGFELISGFGAGRGIDGVWKKKTGGLHYLIAEAKGPGAKLSGGEMTKAWVTSRAAYIPAPDGAAIVKAMNGGGGARVQGLVLRARWHGLKLSVSRLGVPDTDANGFYV